MFVTQGENREGILFFFSSRRRHTRSDRDWSSDVCSSDLQFSSTSKNANRFLNLFSRLFPGVNSLRIIDYGSSWGYLTYQLAKAGHDVQGYEISKSRAAYGVKNLGVEILTEE